MRSAVAVTHVPFEDLGSLADVLAQTGFNVRTIDACTADLRTFDALAPDLLVVLGAPVGVHDTQTYPFLTDEMALVRRRLQASLPIVGICLGAQLMAATLGAAVYAGNSGREIGWSAISAGRGIESCPAMAELLSPGVQVLHWHGDTFDLPSGAAHLAASPRYANQAYAIGAHALALQFHPEVQAATLERWYVGHACELALARIDVAQLRADSARLAPRLEDAAQRFWRRWLDRAFAPQPG